MQNLAKKAAAWIGRALAAEITRPIEEQGKKIDALIAAQNRLEDRVSELHEPDDIAKECDLAVMDNWICSQIDACRAKGYTTANDRRRVSRMHEAYKARGGNHGEENEYAVFCRLPTWEEYERRHGD